MDLQCFQNQTYPGSAGQGLKNLVRLDISCESSAFQESYPLKRQSRLQQTKKFKMSFLVFNKKRYDIS